MSDYLNVEWDDHEAPEKLQRLAVELSDLRVFWPKVIPLFVTWMRRQFETEGAFGGSPWAPLTSDYDAWKAVHYPGKGILYATGDLRRAASLPVRTATATTLTLEIDDSKMLHGGKKARAVAGYHQDGTDKMVARPILFGDPLPPVPEAELTALASGYADELVTRLGL